MSASGKVNTAFCELSNYYKGRVRERTQDQKDRQTDWQTNRYKDRKKEREKFLIEYLNGKT